MKAVETFSEGGVSLSALPRDGSEVRCCPWLDAERWGEVGEPGGGLILASQASPSRAGICRLAGVDLEFDCDSSQNHFESARNVRALRW